MSALTAVYGPLCAVWEYGMPMDMQDGCDHDSCWIQASWGRYPGAPRPPAPIEKTGPWMGGLTSDENGRRLP